MKRIISLLLCCLSYAGVQAQRITREYNNVSLSEALRQLNEQSDEYTISFLYNELEDFRITTSVHRKTIPDAIRQMIGFYVYFFLRYLSLCLFCLGSNLMALLLALRYLQLTPLSD